MKNNSYLACLLALANVLTQVSVLAAPPNILLIAIDDYNDWSGYLNGHPQARTPNIDAFASQGTVFRQAYCNSPSCNPSRASVMSGKHPNSTGLYSNQLTGTSTTIDFRAYYPNAITLPQYFNANGYNTYRSGKIFHLWGDWVTTNGTKTDKSFEFSASGSSNIVPGAAWPLSGINFIHDYCDWGAFDQPESDFGEYSRASIAIQKLNEAHPKPFFIATGFYLPHLPWYFPKSLLNEPALAHIKDVNQVLLPEVVSNDLSDMPAVAVELAHTADSQPKNVLDTNITYSSWHEAITANGKSKEAVQAYLASAYFVDKQVGRLLTALQNSPYKDNTIVILFSDHGWMLGQKEAWSKYKPWQESVRTHFIIKAPGIAPAIIDKPISLVDIYPTLIDLAVIPMKADLDGRVLTPLLKNPSIPWDYPVVTAHLDTRGGWQSVRNERYSYIRYMTNNEEELYDRSADPREWNNLASNASFTTVKNQLRAFTRNAMTPLGSWIPANPPPSPTNPNLILNGNFSSGMTNWKFTIKSPSSATASVVSGQFYADIKADDGTNWHIQLAQTTLSLESGKSYTIRFDAKAQSTRNMAVQIKNGAGTGIVFATKALSTTLQNHSITFTNTSATASNFQMMFFLGAAGVNDVWLDNVQLTKN
jgi:arylsulfatase A-like enzyme